MRIWRISEALLIVPIVSMFCRCQAFLVALMKREVYPYRRELAWRRLIPPNAGNRRQSTRARRLVRQHALPQAGSAVPEAANATAFTSSLLDRVESRLRDDCRVLDGAFLLVSCSGGVDSVALLHLLHRLRGRFDPPLRLEAIHFDHRIRNESAEDAAFVCDLAKSLGINATVEVLSDAERSTLTSGVQEKARRWRRERSREVLMERLSVDPDAGGCRIGSVVLGHQADDQVETVIMKMLRGAHISNLRAMAFQDAAEEVELPLWMITSFIRPLLEIPKRDLQRFLEHHNLTWRDDPSNNEPKYRRNQVRLLLIPLLERLVIPSLDDTTSPRTDDTRGFDVLLRRIGALSRQSGQLRELLDKEAVEWEKEYLDWDQVWLPMEDWLDIGSDMLRMEVLYRHLRRSTGRSCDYTVLEQLAAKVKHSQWATPTRMGPQVWRFALPGQWEAEHKGTALRVRKSGDRPHGYDTFSLGRDGQEVELLVDRAMEVETEVKKWPRLTPDLQATYGMQPMVIGKVGIKQRRMSTLIWINPLRHPRKGSPWVDVPIQPPHQLMVRYPRPGDRFQATSKDKPVRLKDFLKKEVDFHLRDETPLVVVRGEDGAEEVLAVLKGDLRGRETGAWRGGWETSSRGRLMQTKKEMKTAMGAGSYLVRVWYMGEKKLRVEWLECTEENFRQAILVEEKD
ncbi:unnamed protein product [Vitrella brassicaformis CCMP3155]|uniref:tRNA(Ile)-lysidine synthetase n=3 Tax=Vitrella brassicaformis TaxID=1169539 RepID=A0A0G4FYP9_VITBC|nr:unnamed protein product [Vitrella brassicaformis CCMP3155]|eukprot:CEM20566.1 unnamed protein product [Vitrella brassicaformis CCMP3155]